MSILDSYKISYAQNREDVIIEAFFPDVTEGFYVDVGANDPTDDSVTKLFYDKGWHGINIEPSKRLYEKLTRVREKDINIQIGIASKKGKLTFREYDNHGLSTFSEEMKKGYEKLASQKTDTYIEYTIPVKPLSHALSEASPSHIHFMKIDVEGFEYEVLISNDWEKYRPELICIEANHILKDWHPILSKANYELVFFDGLNEYFLAKEAINRKDNFNYADSLILKKPIISPGLANQLRNYEKLQSRMVAIERELDQTQQELMQAINQRNVMFTQLTQYSHLRSQAKMLIINIRKAYRSRLDRFNGPVKLKHVIKLKTSWRELSPQEGSRLAYEYDKKALRETRIINGRMRRMLYKLLDGIDRLAILIAKLMFRILRKILREFRQLTHARG